MGPHCKVEHNTNHKVVASFFSFVRILGERVAIHSLRALLFFSYFFLVEISSCTLIPLIMPGSVHSGSASWDDCGRAFPDELHASWFPDRFPHYKHRDGVNKVSVSSWKVEIKDNSKQRSITDMIRIKNALTVGLFFFRSSIYGWDCKKKKKSVCESCKSMALGTKPKT